MECLCMRSRHTALLSNIYTSVYILHQTIQHSTLYIRLELIFRFCTKYIHGTHRILNSDHTGLKTSNIDTSVSIVEKRTIIFYILLISLSTSFNRSQFVSPFFPQYIHKCVYISNRIAIAGIMICLL